MTKRIVGLVVVAVVVLGAAGVAFAAASPGRPSYELEETALALAADPAPPPAPTAAKREELRTCVKAKVDAGANRKTAVQECATQLGVTPGQPGKPGKPGNKVRAPGLGRAAHAELVVPKRGVEGQWETVIVDRGKITAASAESVSVQRPDGPTVTMKVVAGTKVRGAASAADLAVGRDVVVVSAGGEARSIVSRR
jgi:hypothetical protein